MAVALALAPGMDFRERAVRPEVFMRFYLFHCRWRSHPGGVYFLMPGLREVYGWGAEQALWFAFLNGNTQNPITSLLLHRICPDPSSSLALQKMMRFFRRNYTRLAFDTDRRHWKPHLQSAVDSYLTEMEPYGGSQQKMWEAAAEGGFAGVWSQATRLYSFGRLSTFSYAEYLRIMGVSFDCDTLLLHDRSGSRSHRNGLCIVTGHDELDWHASNPGFNGVYADAFIDYLADQGDQILAEARIRATGQSWAGDVSLFTLESALCTYKSWHRPNRRYPNVYNDMLYDRIRAYERGWPGADFSVFWETRARWLPPHLLLEANVFDPGCVAVKQNHYRKTGQVIMMDRDDPVFRNDFNDGIAAQRYGLRRDIEARRVVAK